MKVLKYLFILSEYVPIYIFCNLILIYLSHEVLNNIFTGILVVFFDVINIISKELMRINQKMTCLLKVSSAYKEGDVFWVFFVTKVTTHHLG